MNYGKINKTDIANGPGVRVSIFVSGCPHKCPGCFNPETWDYEYGETFTIKTIAEILDAMAPDYISGLTILGGEPLDDKNINDVTWLAVKANRYYPNKSIWVYTGGLYEKVKNAPIMRYIDVLVDGPFIEAKKDISLKFRGSRNQRIIDVQASRASGSVKLWEG